MMTFIALSGNHHFVTYSTYKSLEKIKEEVDDYE
jgi:hypothetical protein